MFTSSLNVLTTPVSDCSSAIFTVSSMAPGRSISADLKRLSEARRGGRVLRILGVHGDSGAPTSSALRNVKKI